MKDSKNNNIYDIAKMAGVSITTISRAINRPNMVKPDTLDKIHSIMREMEYTPNALAQGLVLKSTKTIGVIIANINNPFYGEMVKAIEDTASKSGYTIILGNTDNDIQQEEKYIGIFLKKQVDAIIFAGGRKMDEKNNEHIIRTSRYVPVVLTNHYMQRENVYCVLTDEAKGASMAVEYLISKGRVRIAYINGYINSYPSVVKRDNMIATLTRSGLEFYEELEVSALTDDVKGGYDACRILLDRKIEFDALFAANDLMAIGAMKALQKKGLKVPEDVSVMGYDNIYLCNYITPELSSMTQNISQLGIDAVNFIVRHFERKKIANNIKFLKPRLIVRKSC
ncbi:MAG: LacI family DNA-binding transcriptional regulator [Bacillota bacterium]